METGPDECMIGGRYSGKRKLDELLADLRNSKVLLNYNLVQRLPCFTQH